MDDSPFSLGYNDILLGEIISKIFILVILVPSGNVKLLPPRALTLMTWLPDDVSDEVVNSFVPIFIFVPLEIVAVVC